MLKFEVRNFLMKAKLLFLFVFAAVMAGCKKSDFTTKPQVEVKSVKTGEIVSSTGGMAKIYEFELTVTDKEGNAQGEIIIDKLDAPLPACQQNSFSETFPMPEFPSEANQKVTVKVKYAYGGSVIGYRNLGASSCTSPSEPHIAIFSFRIVDKGGDTSNAAQSDPITLPF
jgi:hypothetical protein